MQKIYLIVNLFNNKKYIGITDQTIEKRWYGHCRKESNCIHLKHSIQKYGKDNFKIEHIYSILDDSKSEEIEKEFIDKYNTLHPNGYNLKYGGYKGIPHPETVEKMKEAQQNEWVDNHERRQYYSDWMTESHKDPELKMKLLKGINKCSVEKRRAIIGISRFDGSVLEFLSINHAHLGGYDHGTVCQSLREGMYGLGYYWYYKKDKDSSFYIQKTLDKIGKFDDTDIKPLKATHLETNEILYFDNIYHAKKSGFTYNTIKRCLIGIAYNHKGYSWSFNEINNQRP